MRNEKLVEKLFEKLEALKGCCGLDVNRSNMEALWLGKAGWEKLVGKSYTTIDKPFQHKLAHKVRLSRRFLLT